MAGTSWDRLGLMEQAFELVAPALRRVAAAERMTLHEFFRDDPVWRLTRGEGSVDVAWSEEAPEEYEVSALWWAGETLRRETAGRFTRDRPPDELEAMVRTAAALLPPADGKG